MGRRASSGLNATAIIGIAAVVLVFVAAGALLLKKGKTEGFTGQPLPVEETSVSYTHLTLPTSDLV